MSDPLSWLSWLRYVFPVLLVLAMRYGTIRKRDFILLLSTISFQNWDFALGMLGPNEIRLSIKLIGGAALSWGFAQLGKSLLRKRPVSTGDWVDGGPKPLLFPSRTTHTRFFPKTHSFSYSYLIVGIPVGWKGAIGGILAAYEGNRGVSSSAMASSLDGSWYSVDSGDYLDRGNSHLGLHGKLQRFLDSQVWIYGILIASRADIV